MERMEESVVDAEYESMQNFISDSPWAHQPVLDQIARDAAGLIGGTGDVFLNVDESAFSKKGRSSVGVSRQWNGRQGKVDNCQVGVFAALGSHDKAVLVDARLYLPDEWVNDKKRCRKAGVPDKHIRRRSKVDLALEMIAHARENGIDHQWVGADAFYGNDSRFRRELEMMGELYMVDVHKDMIIYPEKPSFAVPPPASSRGRKPTRPKAEPAGVRVDEWVRMQPESAFKTVTVRSCPGGPLTAPILHRMVWLRDDESLNIRQVHLIVRVDGSSDAKYKFSISNAPEGTSMERLAFIQSQRYWIERAIQDAKSYTGMAEYQVRGWTAWHHHMTMVMLAQLFMLETRIKNAEAYELLSPADVKELLNYFLPKRKISEEEVFRQMEKRHYKRKKVHINLLKRNLPK